MSVRFAVSPEEVDALIPVPFSSVPRTNLLLGCSPIQKLPLMSADLSPSGAVTIWAKREDLNSGLAYGGNKTRKLEYIVHDAQKRGCDTLVSVGGIQSNHTRQVAAVAAASGMKASLINKDWVAWADAGYAKVGNVQLSRLMGAESHVNDDGFDIKATTEDDPAVKKLMSRVRSRFGKPYWIPAGASDCELGGLGFARWAFEVAAQEAKEGIFFDTVVVCAVTGSTFAGMVAGFKLLEKKGGGKRKVIGVDASAKPDATFAQSLKIAKQTAVKIGLKASDITENDIILERRYHGPAYGIPDKATVDAIKYGASKEAFITDPVYEGKTLLAMIAMIKNGDISGGNVLFAHLGGQPAINAYSDMEEQVSGDQDEEDDDDDDDDE